MITLTFNWIVVVMAIIVAVGFVVFIKLKDEDSFGVNAAFGCLIFIISILIAIGIGGIFVW